MHVSTTTRLTVQQKICLFRRRFSGLQHVFGSYDPQTGRSFQVKQFVTDSVLHAHLTGRQSYGVYLLVEDRTRAVVADFDQDDLTGPMEFVAAARRYGLAGYIERSKSKGYHAWIFLADDLPARKARLVAHHILSEIGLPATEVFPKHDALDTSVNYGNFINAPLFGRLASAGRTVFVDPADPTKPAPDQWGLLEQVQQVPESRLDEIIEINGLHASTTPPAPPTTRSMDRDVRTFGLLPCAQRMLTEGVTHFQRVAAFRLAVKLKLTGLPRDLSLVVLNDWASRNRPGNGQRIIRPDEIQTQVDGAYSKDYRGQGCEDPAVKPFCDPACPLYARQGPVRIAEGGAKQP